MRCQFIHEFAEAKQPAQPKKPVQQHNVFVPAAPMNVNSTVFEASKDVKLTPVAVPTNQIGQGAVQAASGTGGLGNKQTATALQKENIVYKDILVHNLHVSIQEFQKKSKMYQKKVTKRRHQEMIPHPEIQYNNIYKSSASRLPVFCKINEEFDS